MRRPPSTSALLLGAIVVAGLGLRLWGLKFGLPQLYYWDEPTVVNRAVRFGSGDLNPHFFYYPALYMYVLFVVSGVYFVGGRVMGVFASASDYAKTYFIDPTGVYLAARVTTAVIGTLAILATYGLGARYFNRRTGLIAAALFAVLPLHVTHSHIAITDVPHALLICLASLTCHRVLSRGALRDYALAGLLIGLGTATKYLAVINVATLCLAHGLRASTPAELLRLAFAPKLWLGLALVFVGFFLGSPYNVLDFAVFIADFREQMRLSAGDANQGALVLRSLLSDLGWVGTATALFGLWCMLRKPSRSTWVFLCFPALYALELLTLSKSFARYLLPQSAFLAVAAGYGVDQFLTLMAAKLEARSVRQLGVGFCLVMLLSPLRLSTSWDMLQASRVDTRTMALAWVERELPPQAPVSLQGLYDRTFDNVPIVTDKVLDRLDRILPNSGSFATIRESILDSWRARPAFRDVGWSENLADLQAAAPRFVFLTDAYGPHAPALLEWLGAQGKLVHRSAPELPWAFGLVHQDIAELLPVIPPTLTVYELSQAL